MKGYSIPLSAQRRFICDLLHFSTGVPTVPVQRRMHIAAVVAARTQCEPRPSWPAIFTKAFALLAKEMPELRRAYVKLPWPRLYQYPISVAGIAVEREYLGERGVFIGRITDPAEMPVKEISRRIERLAKSPIEEIKAFRRALRFTRIPRLLRRPLWWLGLNLPRSRGNLFGTFSVTVYSSLGAESLHPLTPLTCTLTYGIIAPDGGVDVRLVYDHRVLDGAIVARALARLEAILNTEIVGDIGV